MHVSYHRRYQKQYGPWYLSHVLKKCLRLINFCLHSHARFTDLRFRKLKSTIRRLKQTKTETATATSERNTNMSCLCKKIYLKWFQCFCPFSLKFHCFRMRFPYQKNDIILLTLATFCRRRGNGTIEVLFEGRKTQMSAFFPHIFICAFCLCY